MKTPCHNCPFRREGGIRVYRERAAEIVENSTHFPCHKTVHYDNAGDDDHTRVDAETQTCAGYMILLFRENRPNQILQLAHRLGLLDLDALMHGNPAVDAVFESVDELLAASPCRRRAEHDDEE